MSEDLAVHFFTIVLNGEPFVRHHIDVFRQLPFRWHWHVIEGIAELKNDTAWSVANGGRIVDALHRNGLSNDGTSEYLDAVAEEWPEQVTLYRTEGGRFWEGKLEMVQAPLDRIREECLLWEIDSDELWTVEQLRRGRDLFVRDVRRTAAFYLCNMYMGANLVTTTIDTYGNNRSYEWVRTWRFRPGVRWITHEPPRLGIQGPDRNWYDLASINPFLHEQTKAAGLVFDHFAYATKKQVEFKEYYYGYARAVRQWEKLQRWRQFPVRLKDHCAWVTDATELDTVGSRGILPVALRDIRGEWRFRSHDVPSDTPRAVLALLGYLPAEDETASTLLSGLRKQYPHSELVVLCTEDVEGGYASAPIDSVIGVPPHSPGHEPARAIARLRLLGPALLVQPRGLDLKTVEAILPSTCRRIVVDPEDFEATGLGASA